MRSMARHTARCLFPSMKSFIIKSTLATLGIIILVVFLVYSLFVNIKPSSERPSLSGLIPGFLKPIPPTIPLPIGAEPPSPPPPFNEEDQVVNVVSRSLNSVVSIVLTKELPVFEQLKGSPLNDPFVCQFFGQDFCDQFQTPQVRQKGTQKQEIGAGTGFFVRADGLIITNKHVVERDDVDYTVVTNDGEKHPARVLARDPVNDLALISITGKGFPVLTLGDSGKVKLGQTVIAVGNALGQFSNTVSKGIISGLSRSVVAGDEYSGSERLTGVIQTDAAINPGNSGGPLLDLSGEVIGINTAVAGGAQNIGFALPIKIAKHLVDQYLSKGKISYPFLGVRYIIITPEFAKKETLPFEYGALILRGESAQDLAVIPGSPADKAGLTENDIILEVNGAKITADNPVDKVIASFEAGQEITLKVYSKGKTRDVVVKLGERS